jgi:hypothetical protein
MSDFFKHIPFTKGTPLILTVIFTGAVLFFLPQLKVRAAEKNVDRLFAYLDAGDYENAFHQYSSKFHELHDMKVELYARYFEKFSKHKLVSTEPISDNALINDLTLNGDLGADAQNLSFQDYQNKILFKVSYYREAPEIDIEVDEDFEIYCSTPGIYVDAYFGVVQLDAFSWEILFFYPINMKCRGENKYAQYLREQRAEEERQQQLRKLQKMQELISICQNSISYSKLQPNHVSDYSKRKQEEAVKAWFLQKDRFCECIVKNVYPRLSKTDIEKIKNNFWRNQIFTRQLVDTRHGKNNCDFPDLFEYRRKKYSMYEINFK